MYRVWTEEMKGYVIANAGHTSDAELTASLVRITGRDFTVGAVKRMRLLLGLKKQRGRGNVGPRPGSRVGRREGGGGV